MTTRPVTRMETISVTSLLKLRNIQKHHLYSYKCGYKANYNISIDFTVVNAITIE